MPPLADVMYFALALAVAGAISGVLAGLFGIGGGAILVIVFYQVFELVGVDEAVRMHLAIGTSLAVIVPTSIRSYLSHRKRGAVDEAVLWSWIVAVPLGTVLAALVAAYASGTTLRVIFAAIAILVGLRMLFNRVHWKLGDVLPGNPIRGIVGVVIGLLSGLMGVGGGVMSTTFMTLYGRPIHQAGATSAGVGVLVAVPGLLAYAAAGWGEAGLPPLSTGYVNWIAVALIIPITILTAPIGVSLAHRLSRRQLETGFAVFLFTVAARFLWSVL